MTASYRTCCWYFLAMVLALLGSDSVQAQPAEELKATATWNWGNAEQIRDRTLELATALNATPETRAAVESLWSEASGSTSDLLERTLRGIEQVAPEVQPWGAFARGEGTLPSEALPAALETRLPLPWARIQVLAGVGIALSRAGFYDEAVAILDTLEAAETVDPATVLFHRAIARQQLVRREEAITDLTRLLEREEELARRHREVGKLMLVDLESLEADSLDEVARLMNDIRRRQQLFHSGTRVRKEEDDVIAKLDKMIEELEKQRQQMQQQASSSLAPSAPAQESSLKLGSAPGEVDSKPQGSGEDWGNLPAKERAAAMAELAKELPSHYRELIEEYFRKLADESDGGEDQ